MPRFQLNTLSCLAVVMVLLFSGCAAKNEPVDKSSEGKELQSFENQDLVVMVTNDEGKTFNSVKLVSKGFEDNKAYKSEKVYCALHI